jgi:hypothetical protein
MGKIEPIELPWISSDFDSRHDTVHVQISPMDPL